MANEQNLVLQWLILIAAVVLIIGSFSWFAAPVIDCPTCPTCPSIDTPEVNLTSVEESIADIQSTLDEDDDFENSCKDLVREYIEKERRSFMKDIAEVLEDLDREDYKDINKIKIRDLEVADGYDIDEGDCTVNAELRVYYDSDTEDDVRQTIDVEFIIEENEIDEVTVQ